MDKIQALDFLKRISNGISTMFGSSCEAVVHDMLDDKKSIVYIVNSHVTNRNVGDKFKILGGRDIDRFFSGTDIVNSKALTKDHRTLKSSTFHIEGEGYHYALGINFDYTNFAFASGILEDFISVGQDIDELIKTAPTVEERLEVLLDDALKSIGKPISMLNKDDRISVVKSLEEKGAFIMQKSIPIVSKKLNISRYTVYNYLKEIK